jgi:hypothetical protein
MSPHLAKQNIMSCEITTGYSKQACRNRGGVKSIIPIESSNLDLLTVDGTGTVTALTSNLTAYRFSFDVNSASFTQTPTGDRANGSTTTIQGGQVKLKDDELATDQLVNTITKGYHHVVVEFRNGKTKLFGQLNGMTVTTGDGASGEAGTDMNGWTLNFAGDENDVAPIITDAAIITALLTAHS